MFNKHLLIAILSLTAFLLEAPRKDRRHSSSQSPKQKSSSPSKSALELKVHGLKEQLEEAKRTHDKTAQAEITKELKDLRSLLGSL